MKRLMSVFPLLARCQYLLVREHTIRTEVP